MSAVCCAPGAGSAAQLPPELLAGVSYTNYRIASVPWSVHVVRVERTNAQFELHSSHAGKGALGLGRLSAQMASLNPALGVPVAAINGDFYQRFKVYTGDPRGLQIAEGELLSAPCGGVSFWVDALGEPHTTNVVSSFQVTWPDGKASLFGLNEERRPNSIVLYTPAIGASTHTMGGTELVLERFENSSWLPLRIGRTYVAQVREVRRSGNTPLAPGIMVLSLGPGVRSGLANLAPGAVVRLSTQASPDLRGIRTAISGGPVLIRGGKRQRLRASEGEAYESSSMLERHPRSAVGWNEKAVFLVEVDGRQHGLSDGMTLDELGAFLVKLGCEEAMNFDGGGSATLWYNGQVRNSPCDGNERGIANCLVVVRKKATADEQPHTAKLQSQ